ncbi:MAG: hypothetical protein ACTS27_02885 [Phycisphaerales bacterium]
MLRHAIFGCAISVAIVSTPALADLIRFEATGEWDFGMIRSGPLNGVNSGAASMRFDMDSDDFIDSTNFPTRGYRIIQNTFALTVDGITVGLPDPYPMGEDTLFVLRNNDPAVDGFFLGSSVDGFPNGVSIDNAGLLDTYLRVLFSATYGNDPISSLDIRDAVGTYTFDGLTVFNWGFEDGGNQIAGMIFDQFTISVVPAPGVPIAFGAFVGALAIRRRRLAKPHP